MGDDKLSMKNEFPISPAAPRPILEIKRTGAMYLRTHVGTGTIGENDEKVELSTNIDGSPIVCFGGDFKNRQYIINIHDFAKAAYALDQEKKG
jgi:hypothetical protein